MMVIEATFSKSEKGLASRSMHHCAGVILQELQVIEQKNSYSIYITHTNPAEADAIMQEVELLNPASGLIEFAIECVAPEYLITDMQRTNFLTMSRVLFPASEKRLHKIGWLKAGQEFAV